VGEQAFGYLTVHLDSHLIEADDDDADGMLWLEMTWVGKKPLAHTPQGQLWPQKMRYPPFNAQLSIS